YPSYSPAALPKAPTHYQSERYHSRTAKGVPSNHSQLQWRVRNRSNSPRLPPPPPRRQSPSTPDTPSIILLPHSSTTDQDMGPAASNASLPSIPAGGKRRGRPPRPKKATANPKIMGGSAKKRIFSKIQASQARQTATPSKAARARARPALNFQTHKP
ncbi:hypothetical protein HID58_062078, partial [Brassica napus]